MKRRNFILSGGALATISLSATATSAGYVDSVSFGSEFQVVPSSPQASVEVMPVSPNDESTHRWQLDQTTTNQDVE